MKRWYFNMVLTAFNQSIGFSSSLSAAAPTVVKGDDAKWMLDEGQATCCYSKPRKSWIADPDSIVWEAFLTNQAVTGYGEAPELAKVDSKNPTEGQCCVLSLAPAPQRKQSVSERVLGT